MPFKPLDSVPSVGVVRGRRFLSSWPLAFAAGLFSIIGTFAAIGGVEQRLVVWPVSGILLALSLPYASALGHKRLPTYLAGGAGVFVGGVLTAMPWRIAVVISGLTVLDLIVAGHFLSPYIRNFDDLKKRRNGVRLVVASVVAPLITGFLSALRFSSFLKLALLTMAVISTLANTLGIAICVLTVLFVTTGEPFLKRKLPAKPLPLLLTFVLFTLICGGTFWQTTGPYLFLIFPAMMLLLLASGLEGALFCSILITIIGTFATARGHGPIWLVHTSSPAVRLITLQIFIWASILTALPVGATLDERRKAELAVTNSRSVQRTILRHTREAIILYSLDGGEHYASEAIEQLTGWTPAEYIGFDRMATVHPDDRVRARDMIDNLVCGDEETSLLRYRILHKNGGWSWVEASVSVYGEGKIAGYVGTVRDITSLIETEEGWSQERRAFSEQQQRLAEAEIAARFQLQLRDEFLSHVSHELRSPLTSIYSFSSIIADGLAGETTSEQDEYLGIVLKNVLQLQSMIEDLLTVTQSGEGKLNIEPRAVSLVEAIADAFNTVRGLASRKRIALSVEPWDGPSCVYADPIRVRQVLIILLDNAIKFTPEGGSVRICIQANEPEYLVTKVLDTGLGIREEKWNLIFNKLYQILGPEKLDASMEGRTGLGLGLHIAKSLVVRQSGRIWVTSIPGKGSIFHFTLPVYKKQDIFNHAEGELSGSQISAVEAVF